MIAIRQEAWPRITRSKRRLSSVFACGLGVGVFLSAQSAIAQATDVPWECSEYSSEAQARCMNTLLELQREKIAKLEEQLKTQEGTVNKLKEKMERQEAISRREVQASKQDPRYPPPSYMPTYAPSYYAHPYGYAPLPPIGIYLQPPWRVPRYYGYGPGYWGQPGLSFNFRFGGGHKLHRR